MKYLKQNLKNKKTFRNKNILILKTRTKYVKCVKRSHWRDELEQMPSFIIEHSATLIE